AGRTAVGRPNARLARDGDTEEFPVLYGDTPFLATETLSRLLAERHRTGAAVLVAGMRPVDPGPYGRFVLAADGALERIVEAADASPEEAAIGLVNGGGMVVEGRRRAEVPAGVRRRTPQTPFSPSPTSS